MRRFLIATVMAAFILSLSGCSTWFSESYVSVTPHRGSDSYDSLGQLRASSYWELYTALSVLVGGGEQKGIILLSDLSEETCESYLKVAIGNMISQDPVGVYAVEDITFELGTNAGQLAAAVQVDYSRSKSDLLQIKKVANMSEAETAIGQALEQAEGSITLLVEDYAHTDFVAFVRSYAEQNPAMVMETPQVMSVIYPDSGESRLVEINFTYQTEQEELLRMQKFVRPVFTSAELYIQGNATPREKYLLLYSFLMERFDYEIAHSVTPAYSLLQDGRGDHSAFACIYAAMCNQSGLDASVISGTRDGEAWSWNKITIDGRTYYVDLMESSRFGALQIRVPSEMGRYVWDNEE